MDLKRIIWLYEWYMLMNSVTGEVGERSDVKLQNNTVNVNDGCCQNI